MNLTAILRTVVTLLLIVAVTVQPMVAYAMLPVTDSSPQAATMEHDSGMCVGCGCCELSDGETTCCCCGDGVAQDSDESFEADDIIRSACHCGVTVPPLSRDLPRTELLRQITLRVVTDRTGPFDFPDDRIAAAFERIDSASGSRSDFSQRMLCVWRI